MNYKVVLLGVMVSTSLLVQPAMASGEHSRYNKATERHQQGHQRYQQWQSNNPDRPRIERAAKRANQVAHGTNRRLKRIHKYRNR